MASTLSRLLLYAQTENTALENFTTEALAHAIRHEPDRFLHVLRAKGLPLPETAREVSVHTQLGIAGAGIIDLVLIVDSTEVWVEVKVNAPESGDQLTNYRRAINERPQELRPHLVVLSPRPLGDPDTRTHTFVEWQDIWRATHPKQTTSPLWRDLRRFLEEERMADRFETPLSAREACAQGDAFALARKMESVLVPVVAHGHAIAPKFAWPTKRIDVRKQLIRSFGGWGAYTIGTKARFRAGISLGAYFDEESAESWAGLRVWPTGRDPSIRRQIVDHVESRSGLTDWEKNPSDDPDAIFARYQRLATFDSLINLSEWFNRRLDELQAAAVFDLIAGLGTSSSPSAEDQDVDGV